MAHVEGYISETVQDRK